MICKNCGKEIPENTRFCGYCGTLQETEEIIRTMETVTEETETAVPAEAETPAAEEETKETEEVSVEEAVEETVEKEAGDVTEVLQTVEEPAAEEVTEVMETVEETAAEEAEEPAEPEPVDAEFTEVQPEIMPEEEPVPLTEPERPVKESKVKKAVVAGYLKTKTVIRENVHKEDFVPLLSHLAHPSEDTEFTPHCAWTVYLLLMIFNTIAFHNFVRGFLGELILIVGAVAVQLANHDGQFRLGRSIRNAARMLEVPAILLFAACLFSASAKDYVQYTVCVGAAGVKYILNCSAAADRNRSGYLQMALISAAVLGAAFVTGLF